MTDEEIHAVTLSQVLDRYELPIYKEKKQML